MKRLLLGIDHGNRNIKTAHTCFDTGVYASQKEPPFGSSDCICYKGMYYSLDSRVLGYVQDKTINEDFFMLTLFAIAKEIIAQRFNEEEYSLVLAVGLPPMHFAKGHKKFKQYFMERPERIEFEYNKRTFKLHLENVYVFPQAYSAAMASENAEFVCCAPWGYIIDIGGYTVDFLEMRNGQPQVSSCRSLPRGILKLSSTISNKLLAETGMEYKNQDIEDILLGKEVYANEEARKIVDTEAKKWTESILQEIRLADVDIRTKPSLLIGGGSILLAKYIDQSSEIGVHRFENNIGANAIGYAMLAQNLMQ